MKLISIPAGFYSTKKADTKHFHNFSLTLTKRNWSGKTYVDRKDCLNFTDELMEYQTIYKELFERTLGEEVNNVKIQLVIDVGMFSGELPYNDKLIDFLEELEDFSEMESASTDKERNAIKYKKKLNTFIQKPENIPYLLRWLHLNPNHSFFNEYTALVEKTIGELGVRDKNKIEKDLAKVSSETKDRLMEVETFDEFSSEVREYVGSATRKLIEILNDRVSLFLQTLFKNCFDEPLLLFYAMHAFRIYLNQLADLPGVVTERQYKQVFIQKSKNKIEFYLTNIMERESETFIANEALTTLLSSKETYLPKSFLDFITHKDIKNYDSSIFKDMAKELKKLTNESLVGIDNEKRLDSLFKSNSSHFIDHPLFKDTDIQKIMFDKKEQIGGPDEEETYIVVSAITADQEIFTFPLVDTKNWRSIPPIQAALTAYAVCLMHDYCIEDNAFSVTFHGQSNLKEDTEILVKNLTFDNLQVKQAVNQ